MPVQISVIGAVAAALLTAAIVAFITTPVVRTLAEMIRTEGFEIVHCHGSRANLLGTMLQQKVDVPMVTTVHSDYRLDYLGRPFHRLTYGTINTVCVRRIPYHIGVSNLMSIYSAVTGKTFAEIEAEFDGQGYGAFKPAVGEAVVETLRPIREEAGRILKDKAYLESVYKAGAEKASYVANKTLRKVYKKVGFVAR